MVKNLLNWVEPVDNRKNFISCDMKLPNGYTNLPIETSQITTKKAYKTK